MKRIFATIISLLMLPVFAMEWGGLFTEDMKYATTEFSEENTGLRQSNSLILWTNVPLAASGNTYFSGQTSVKYYTDIIQQDGITPIFDIDLLKISSNFFAGDNVFSFSAGRFGVSDLTGKIFNQTSDGLAIKLTRPTVEFTAYAGYTGLLNAYNVSMITAEAYSPVYIEGYCLSYKYLPCSLSIEMPAILSNQTLNVQASAFIDMEKPGQDDSDNRYYGSLSMMGPIAGPVYYSFLTSFGSENFTNIFNYSALSIQYYLGSLMSVKGNIEYASGNQLAFTSFKGFSSNTAYNSLSSPELSGLIMPNIDMAVTIQNFYVGLNGKIVLGYPDSNIYFQGLNVSANIIFNIFSDLQLGVLGSYYYDMYWQGKENYFTANVNLSISF